MLSPSPISSTFGWVSSCCPDPRRVSMVMAEMWDTDRYSLPWVTPLSPWPTGMQVKMSMVPSVSTGSDFAPSSLL